MIVLDAYGLVAFLGDEPAADAVEDLLTGGGVAMTAINLAEAMDILMRTGGVSEPDLHGWVDALLVGPLATISVTTRHAWIAARLRRKHYRRGDSAVSIADCFALAGCGPGDQLATADRALLAMAEAEDVATIRLLDSRGR